MPRARKPLDEKSVAISFSLPFAMERMIEAQLTRNMGRSEWIVDAIKMKMENQKIRNEITSITLQDEYGGRTHVKRKRSNILPKELSFEIPKEIGEKMRMWAMPKGIEYEEAVIYILADFFGLTED